MPPATTMTSRQTPIERDRWSRCSASDRRCWSLLSYSGRKLQCTQGTVSWRSRQIGHDTHPIAQLRSRRRCWHKPRAPKTENWGNRDRASHCEIREFTIADTGRLNVDAGTNGGVRVTGSDRSNVLIRARVQTNATTPEEAKALATQVQVQATPGIVRADGPGNLKDRGWSVSYEVLVPRRSGLTLRANNGGIGISDVEGDISFETRNGGVTLNRLGRRRERENDEWRCQGGIGW